MTKKSKNGVSTLDLTQEELEEELMKIQAGKMSDPSFRNELAEAIAREDSWGRNFVPGWKGLESVGRDAGDLEEELRQTMLVNTQLERVAKLLTSSLRSERKTNKHLRKTNRRLVGIIQKHTDTVKLNAVDLHFFEILLEEMLAEPEKVS